MPHVLLVIGDATEVLDTMYPYFRIAEDGYEVHVAAPEKRVYHMVQHEQPPGWDVTRETAGYHLQADIAFRDVNPDEYVGLFVSGGRAPEYLRYDPDLLTLTSHFFHTGKPVASVCHGIEIIAAAGGLQGGRRATTVGKCALDITQTGGVYVNEPCVVDGNVVSAATWHDYGTKFFRVFIDKMNKPASR